MDLCRFVVELKAKLKKDMALAMLAGPMGGKIVRLKKDTCLQIPCATPPALKTPPNNCDVDFPPPRNSCDSFRVCGPWLALGFSVPG